MKCIEDRVEQVIRNIQRRKYSKIVPDYANAGVDLFDENQFAWDLGIKPDQLEDILNIKRTTPWIGSKGIMFKPSPKELREAIPKIKAITSTPLP